MSVVTPVQHLSLKGLPDFIDLPDTNLPPLDQMNHVVSQVLPGTLSIKFTRLTEDEMWGEIPFEQKNANAFGIMHGGSIFSLGDTITGCFLWAKGEIAVTSASEIKYLRPVKEGIITCKARELSRSGNKIRLTADYFNEDKKRIARMKIDYVVLESA